MKTPALTFVSAGFICTLQEQNVNNKQYKRLIPLLLATMTLTACGGGNGNTDEPDEVQNQAPAAVAGNDMTVYEQTEVTLTGSATDVDGTIASYSWTQTAGSAVTLASAESASATFTAPDISETEQLTFQLTVTDNDGATASDSVNVTVNPVSILPIAQAGEDQSVMTGSQVLLTGSGADSDGEIVQYQWTQTSGDAVTIAQADQAQASFYAPDTEQTLTFELTVTDNDGNTASDTVAITTQMPSGFNLIDSAQQAQAYPAGTNLSWSVTNYDPDVHVLTWQVTSDAPVKASTFGSSVDNPDFVSFTTLSMAEDANVTISVDVRDGGSTYSFSKTIIMLADEDFKFTRAQAQQTALSQIGETGLMKIADVNNDSYNDIVYTAASGLKVFYGDADNGFTAQDLGFGAGLLDFSIIDMNNDNLNDFMISYPNQVGWSFYQGDNSFGEEQTIAIDGIELMSAKAADLDNDIDTDIAFIYRVNGAPLVQLAWFEQDGGSFNTPQIIDEQINPFHSSVQNSHFVLDDFNNDNRTDIIIATASGDDAKPVVSYTQTDDGFDRNIAFNLLGSGQYYSVYADGIISVDINQDGFNDLVTWNTSRGFNSVSAGAEYHINQQDGTFSTQGLSAGFARSVNLQSVDIDADGDTDLLMTNNNSLSSCDIGCTAANNYTGQIRIIENQDGFLNGPRKILGNPDNGLQTQVGDIDNDGDIDVINIDGNAWIYENKAND